MKKLTLYSTQDARHTMANKKITGLNASILKWQMIEIALNEIFDNINSNCGLCIEGIDKDPGTMCDNCPVNRVTGQECVNDQSNYARSKLFLHDVIYHATQVLEMLNKIKHDKAPTEWKLPEIGWGKFQDHFESEYNKAWNRLLNEQPGMLDTDMVTQSSDIAAHKTTQHIESMNIKVIKE